MRAGKTTKSFIFAFIFLLLSVPANAVWDKLSDYAPPPVLKGGDKGIPNMQLRVHKVGDTHMSITNWGMLGSQMGSYDDPETGLNASSCEHPAGSGLEHLFHGGLWVGAIVDNDTLVTVGLDGWQHVNEMYPAAIPGGNIEKRSNNPSSPDYHPDAISEADYIATYQDTLTDPAYVSQDPYDARPHIPLNLEIRQESYSWSDSEYEDFIIIKYVVKNMGMQSLQDMYFGFFFDSDVLHAQMTSNGYSDDISGFYTLNDPQTGEDVHIAWSADNDGDPTGGSWGAASVRGVFGVSLLEFPAVPGISFNWWVSEQFNPALYDWGPMMTANYRDFGTGGLGTPEGDCNKYYIMSNGEFDYDQIYTVIDYTDEGWMPPPAADLAHQLANGYDTRFLISFGTVDLAAGDSTQFAIAVAVGDDFHQNPNDFQDYFDADNPDPFYNTLDFSDLVNDIMAARNLYFEISGYACGDFDGNETPELNDIIYAINYIFAGGPGPMPLTAGDVNCSGKINLVDVIFMVNFVFRDGNEPCDVDGDGVPDC